MFSFPFIHTFIVEENTPPAKRLLENRSIMFLCFQSKLILEVFDENLRNLAFSQRKLVAINSKPQIWVYLTLLKIQ